MSASVLVGRRLATGALRSAVDGALAGAGGVALLVGDAGIGKTALAREATAYARSHHAAVVWGTCWEGGGTPGYWPWVQVVRTLARSDGGAGTPILGDLSGSTDRAGGILSDDAATQFRTYDLTTGYLRDAATQRPLVIVLDDLHWADLSSLRLLLFLARRLHDVAVLVIGTYRDVDIAEDHPARTLLADLAGQSELVRLTGLTADEVGMLLHTVGGERPPAELADAVHERTGGNPFFVQQIAQLFAAQGFVDRALPTGVPPVVGDVLGRRLARLPQPVVDLLGVAAVVGRRFSVTTVAAVAGIAATSARPLVEVAVRAGIVEQDTTGQTQFSHDLFREVLYDRLPSSRRSAVHLAVAEFLERQPDQVTGAAEIAHHRARALPLGDLRRAIAALVEAGRTAMARKGFDEAVAHLRLAVDVAVGVGGADPAVLCEYAEALRRAGRGDEAQAAFRAAAERARSVGDTVVLSRAAFGSHRVATLTDSSRSEVISLIEEALAAMATDDERPGRDHWLLSAALARELADGPQQDRPRARALADAAITGARTDRNRDALAYALFALCDARWEPGSASERLGIAEQLAVAATDAGQIELLFEAHLAKLAARLELGDPSYLLELDTLTRLAEQTAIPHYRYLASSRHATRACLTGPFGRADELIEAAAAFGERIGEPDAWAVQASQLAGLAMVRHDWTRLSVMAQANGRALTPPEFALHERTAVLIEAGDLQAAAAIVAGMADRTAAYRWRQTAFLAWDAELAAAVGDRARCAALYEQLLPVADEFAIVGAAVFTTGPVALQLGLLAAALERWDAAIAHLEDAVARCERLGAVLHAERARAELAQVRGRRDGRRSVAGENLFRRDGDVWTLAFAGHSVRLHDAKGLRDLAVLMAVPGREVAATDLVAGAGGAGPMIAALGADPVLDDRARAAYRARLAALDAQLAEADADDAVARSVSLAAERDALIDELGRASGLGGRPRRLGDAGERARSTATARIRAAITRIGRAHPELGRHLRAAIVTGTRCAYRPAETVRWTVSQS